MLNFKDVIKFTWNKQHSLEVPLYYATKESSQIVTFLVVGTLADCPGLEITHYIFASRNFVKLDKGQFIQEANNRKGRDNCSPGVRYSSTYLIRNPKTKEVESVDFTFLDPNHMATLYQYFVPAINKYLVGVKHYRRVEYGGEWFETGIVPSTLGYPSTGIGATEKSSKTGDKTKGSADSADND